MGTQPLVSIVIPVLDDDAALEVCLRTVTPADADVEVIVVDGGMPGRAVAAPLREAHPLVQWLQAPPGRGRQMNVGAVAARGRWLLFLHSDTRLGAGWLEVLRRLDGDLATAGGCFRFALDSPDWRARAIERGVAWRVRHLGLPYGDQALFVRREIFESLDGYAELPLMEDVEFVRRLGHCGRIAVLSIAATTSARRWERDGWVRRSLRNVVLQVLYFAGISPGRLVRLYGGRAPGRARSL